MKCLNKKVIIILMYMALLTSLCGCMQKAEKEPEKEANVSEYLKLHYGGLFAAISDPTYDVGLEGDTLWIDFVFIPEERVKTDAVEVEFLLDNPTVPERETRIFYCPEKQSEISYGSSSFCIIDNTYGTEALIFVFAPSYIKIGPFEESPAYGEVPSDTLGTEPLVIQNEEWLYNYPLWVFDVSLEDLPEDYELHYAGFVLTAEDLLSGSWSPP